MAFLDILMNIFQNKYYRHVKNAVLAVCAKSGHVWVEIGEMIGLLP